MSICEWPGLSTASAKHRNTLVRKLKNKTDFDLAYVFGCFIKNLSKKVYISFSAVLSCKIAELRHY
jgi:hypothetical protein